jgi:hypothetical protein
VRQAAAECLAGLASSAYAQRAVARADFWLNWEPAGKGLAKLLRKAKLVIELPSALDKAALRDGIEAKPPAQRQIGERAFWLTQMVARVPPAHWTERFACSPAELLDAAGATEYAQELLGAWSTAALRHPAVQWLDALCAAWLASKQEPQLQSEALVRLLAAAGERRQELLLKYVRSLLPNHFEIALFVLSRLQLPWTPDITQLVLAALRVVVHRDKQKWSHARNTLQSEALLCDISTARQQWPRLLEAATRWKLGRT